MTRVGVRTLRSGDVGSYKAGCFYSEAMFGVPYETGMVHDGIGLADDPFTAPGPVEGGPDATARTVTLLHETAHLVQDLALGAAVEHDLLRDESLGILLVLLRRLRDTGDVRLPLTDPPAGLDADGRRGVALLRDRDATAGRLRDDTVEVGPVGARRSRHPVSADVLMEGLAAAQAARALRGRARTDEHLDHLTEAREIIQILPEQLGAPYDSALQVVVGALGRMPPGEGRPWPRDVASGSGLEDVASTLLADLACHVPPVAMVSDRVRSGRNSWLDFLPGSRFVMAVLAIERAGGFPDAPPGVSGNDCYRQVFDLVATAWGWPSWEETSRMWLGRLARLKQSRRSATDAFRFRLLVERDRAPARFVLADPVHLCWSQLVPILHLTPTGMKILQGVTAGENTVVFPFEQPLTALQWLRVSPEPWQDLPAGTSLDDAMEHHRRVAMPLFLQEVVSRTIARSFQEAATGGAHFCCPYARVGCAAATARCAAQTALADLPADGCAVRHWLGAQGLAPDRLAWSS